jgi:hypothetical protein
MPVIPVTRKAEVGELKVQDQPKQFNKTLAPKKKKNLEKSTP